MKGCMEASLSGDTHPHLAPGQVYCPGQVSPRAATTPIALAGTQCPSSHIPASLRNTPSTGSAPPPHGLLGCSSPSKPQQRFTGSPTPVVLTLRPVVPLGWATVKPSRCGSPHTCMPQPTFEKQGERPCSIFDATYPSVPAKCWPALPVGSEPSATINTDDHQQAASPCQPAAHASLPPDHGPAGSSTPESVIAPVQRRSSILQCTQRHAPHPPAQ